MVILMEVSYGYRAKERWVRHWIYIQGSYDSVGTDEIVEAELLLIFNNEIG